MWPPEPAGGQQLPHPAALPPAAGGAPCCPTWPPRSPCNPHPGLLRHHALDGRPGISQEAPHTCATPETSRARRRQTHAGPAHLHHAPASFVKMDEACLDQLQPRWPVSSLPSQPHLQSSNPGPYMCRRVISLRSMSTSPRVSVLTCARLRICLARAAKARVDCVSCAESALGLMLAMMVVLELPPRESCSAGLESGL